MDASSSPHFALPLTGNVSTWAYEACWLCMIAVSTLRVGADISCSVRERAAEAATF